ncbi:MAG: hypothetical protein K2Q06_07730 [Parvularculaceae bacterium]|nr:hypothetical protein [Parvularculaceae bacterium]
MDGQHPGDLVSEGLALRLIDIYRLASDAGERTAREALRSAIQNADLRDAVCGVDGRRFRSDVRDEKQQRAADEAYRLGFAEGFAEICVRLGVPVDSRAA